MQSSNRDPAGVAPASDKVTRREGFSLRANRTPHICHRSRFNIDSAYQQRFRPGWQSVHPRVMGVKFGWRAPLLAHPTSSTGSFLASRLCNLPILFGLMMSGSIR
jgi:hypothetical protein